MAITFMFIDDDSDDRELFCEALWDLDPSVRIMNASSAANAFEMLGQPGTELPDVIFLDINMPIMSGWECLVLLKENKSYEHIPVVMHSTSSNPREKEKARAGGALGLVAKPADFEVLKQNLAQILAFLQNGTSPAFF